VQRGLIGRPPRADRRAHQQREDADRGENVIEQPGSARHRRQREVHHIARAEPQQCVGMARAGLRLVLQREHIGAAVDGLIVDGEEDVSGTHAGAARR
jgi:hypothetical protein